MKTCGTTITRRARIAGRCCLAVALSGTGLSAQTLIAREEGGWITQGLSYQCRIGADGKLQSLTVGDFNFVGNADGIHLVDGDEPVGFTSATVTRDILRVASPRGDLRVRFLARGPEITLANRSNLAGHVLRLRFTDQIARVKPLGRSAEPAMPLTQGVGGALRFIAPNGSSLTFGRADSYHLGAACQARPGNGTIEVLMPWVVPGQTMVFPLTVGPTPFLEDAVQVEGTTERPDNIFWDNKPFDLHVSATNMDTRNPLQANLVLKLRHYLTRQLVHEEAKPLALAAGATGKFTWTIANLDPMLYTADVWIEQDGKQGFCSSPRFVFNASQILPPALPDDFDAFWARTLKEQAAIPLDLKMTKVREEKGQELYNFSFAGLLGYRCYGWLTVPKDRSQKWPAVLVLPPAGMRSQPIPWRNNEVGMAININTVDVSLPEAEYDWRTWPAPYLVTGILDKDHYGLRFGYAAIARAYDVLAARAEVDTKQIRVQGSSQGGGLTLIAAGLIPDAFASATARKPGLCRLDWNLEYLNPPFFPIAATEDGKPMIHQTLKYFLPCHFARRITCPIDISLGIYDDVTPGVSVFCAYNAIPGQNKTLTVDAHAGH